MQAGRSRFRFCMFFAAGRMHQIHVKYERRKDEKTTCTPCEQNFEKNVDRLVGQVENYTEKDRVKKEREVEEAFPATGREKKD